MARPAATGASPRYTTDDALRDTPAASANVVITNPPFGSARH